MCGETCDYTAHKNEPEGWHGQDPSEWGLDRLQATGGLGIEEWQCPHPPLEPDNVSDNNDQFCVFHTDPGELPEDVDERAELLDAIENANERSKEDRPEHRCQFVGATFGAIDLADVTIAAEENRDIRFDHAVFQSQDEDLNFEGTTFIARGTETVSFYRTTFINEGSGHVRFRDATFQTNGHGHVRFDRARFLIDGHGDVQFGDATFQTNGDGRGNVRFQGAKFRTNGDGDIQFRETKFRTNGDGDVGFDGASFLTDGHVRFREATFQTNGHGQVVFQAATFQTNGDGDVDFLEATFRTNDNSHVWFRDTTLRAGGDGQVLFGAITVTGHIHFEECQFSSTVYFTDIEVDGTAELIFSKAEFEKACILGETSGVSSIDSEFDFSEAMFHRGLDLRGGQSSIDTEGSAQQPATAEGRRFEVIVEDGLICTKTTFPDGLDFGHAWFAPSTTFDGSDLSGANFTGANLEGVSLERARLNRTELFGTTFVGAKLYGALFGDARINRETTFWPERTDISFRELLEDGAHVGRGIQRLWRNLKTWGRGGRIPYCVYDPRYEGMRLDVPNQDPETASDLEKAAEVYGTLESLARDNSIPGLASECFLGRKDVQRKQYQHEGRTLMGVRSWVPNLVARYGESPWRVLGTGAGIILLWGILYSTFQLIERGMGSDAEPITVIEGVYFSALTFTTLGYGDFNPTGTPGQFLAVAETSLGVILLAILVFVFGRRATR